MIHLHSSCIYIFETQKFKHPCLCREMFDPIPGLSDYLEDVDYRDEMSQCSECLLTLILLPKFLQNYVIHLVVFFQVDIILQVLLGDSSDTTGASPPPLRQFFHMNRIGAKNDVTLQKITKN